MATGDSSKVVVAALLANIGVAVVKGVAAAITGSGAMLAETIHSIADSGNQALLLLGAHRARRPPDERHPFGYGSERYFWAFVVALVLFALGSLFSLYEGVHKLRHPEPITSPVWAYVVLVAAMLLEGGALLVARRAVSRVRGRRSFWRFFQEHKDPALPLVFLEDSGALVGLTIALTGIACSHVFGWLRADAVATLAIGVLLGVIAVILLVRCHRLLIGESASRTDSAAIVRAVSSVAGVKRLVDLKTLHLGPETLLVALEVRLEGGGETVDAIEEAIRAVVPNAKHIVVEPD